MEKTLAKRATLCDQDDREIAHLSFAEMDDYIERGLVERLTPVRASTHRFRLLVPTLSNAVTFSETSLTFHINQANAGACYNDGMILWAQRKVRKWPHVGDTRAVRVACRK
jgi:hypothetical protein